MEKALFSWSGGKDSALGLYEVLEEKNLEIVSLLTTITADFDRITMHGVRRTLLEGQVESLGFPLEKLFLKKDHTCEQYSDSMKKMLEKNKEQGVSSVVFGDVFLEDVRKFREEKMKQVEMAALFPLWKKDTKELAQQFIDLGFKAVIVCVDSKALGKEFVGRELNQEFLNDLSEKVDPCGENGEFHSFVYDGPIFKKPVEFEKGEIVFRENRFYFCDLI